MAAVAHGLSCGPVRGTELDAAPPEREDLTPREADVLDLLITGASNKDIARQLEISVHTVKFHVAAILAKLGAKGRTGAVARAIRDRTSMI